MSVPGSVRISGLPEEMAQYAFVSVGICYNYCSIKVLCCLWLCIGQKQTSQYNLGTFMDLSASPKLAVHRSQGEISPPAMSSKEKGVKSPASGPAQDGLKLCSCTRGTADVFNLFCFLLGAKYRRDLYQQVRGLFWGAGNCCSGAWAPLDCLWHAAAKG